MLVQETKEHPRDVCYKIEQCIRSSTTLQHIQSCKNMISNFEVMYGSNRDEQFSVDRFNSELECVRKRIIVKDTIEKIADQKTAVLRKMKNLQIKLSK